MLTRTENGVKDRREMQLPTGLEYRRGVYTCPTFIYTAR